MLPCQFESYNEQNILKVDHPKKIALISTLVWIFSLTVDHPKKFTSISTHSSPHSSFHTPAPKELYSLKTKYKTNNHSSLYIHMPMWKIISFELCCHPHATTKIGSLKKDYESNNHSCHQFFHVNGKKIYHMNHTISKKKFTSSSAQLHASVPMILR